MNSNLNNLFSLRNLFKVFQLLAAIIIAIILFKITLKNYNFSDLLITINTLDWRYLFVSIFFFGLELILRSLRWFIIIKSQKKLPDYQVCFFSYLYGYTFNNILAIKLGEIFKLFYYSKSTNYPKRFVLITIIIDRIFDIFVILFFSIFFLSAILFEILNDKYFIFLPIIVTTLLIFLVSVLIIYSNKNLYNLFIRIFKKFLSIFSYKKLYSFFYSLVLSSIFIYIFNIFGLLFILKSVSINLNIVEILTLFSIIGLFQLIPSAPASLGILQYAFFVFSNMYNLDTSLLISCSFIIQIFVFGFYSGLGYVSFLINYIFKR